MLSIVLNKVLSERLWKLIRMRFRVISFFLYIQSKNLQGFRLRDAGRNFAERPLHVKGGFKVDEISLGQGLVTILRIRGSSDIELGIVE